MTTRGLLSRCGMEYGNAHIDRHTALTNWFFEEASKGARERFGTFLDFEEWR